MLRITTAANDPAGILLIVEGRLVGPWVAELETAVAKTIHKAPGDFSIDLSAVSFIDAKGFELLCRLRDRGVVFQAVSPFVQELLNLNR